MPILTERRSRSAVGMRTAEEYLTRLEVKPIADGVADGLIRTVETNQIRGYQDQTPGAALEYHNPCVQPGRALRSIALCGQNSQTS